MAEMQNAIKPVNIGLGSNLIQPKPKNVSHYTRSLKLCSTSSKSFSHQTNWGLSFLPSLSPLKMQFLRSYSHYMSISKLSDHIHPLRSHFRAFHKTPISQNPSSKNSAPLTTKYAKHHRGTMKGESSSGNQISFGGYALQALEPAWVTSQQIIAGRKAITGYARRAGKIWVRIIADKSVTGRPTGVRMGRGKGPAKYSVAVVKPGRILYEMSGVSEMVAKEAISIAASKLPMRTQFVNGSLRTKPTSESSPAKITNTHLEIAQSQSHIISSGFSPICAQKGLMKMSNQSVGFPTCVSGVSSVRAYSSFYGNQGDDLIAKGLNFYNSDGIGSDGGHTSKNAWQSVADAESFLQQKANDPCEARTPHVGSIGGLAALVGNVLSSLSMRFTKPLSVGNTIQAGSIEGQVVEMDHTTISLTK